METLGNLKSNNFFIIVCVKLLYLFPLFTYRNAKQIYCCSQAIYHGHLPFSFNRAFSEYLIMYVISVTINITYFAILIFLIISVEEGEFVPKTSP